ncbi:sensor histidine kinase [Rubrivirga sp. IMCC43871]|uniref:sensor histidine kinase n=1 Tax=Rubrivirga sp. IMCC43871 TaxID=3391575 RepID=UPI00398FAC84
MPSTPPRALRRLAVALLALAIAPAAAFAVLQGIVQSESDARLAQIRDDQLDGLLFSVNQNAWDTVSAWADRLARTPGLDGDTAPEAAADFRATAPPVRFVVVADTARSQVRVFGDVPGPADLEALLPDTLVSRLLAQRAAGYRKLEPVPLADGRLALAFVADAPRPGGPPRLLALALDPQAFVEAFMMPKLREVARGGVELGVFHGTRPTPIAATAALTRGDIERQRPLWLLPDYAVGARVGEGSVEAALRRRVGQSLGLLGGVSVILGLGALFAWRGVQREVAAARLREDFVSNVSHELRTPLALIRMYAETLAAGRVPPGREARYYATILAESERLSRLVGNVLHFNRFERGTAHLARRPLDLGALVSEVAERYRPVVEQADCTLAAETAPLPVSADADALAEAVVNLLDNAVKYGGPGPIEVSTRRTRATAVVEVSDRGPGLPAADRERVFEPFVRVQPASADGLVHTAKGTGLGLALVRRIARAHGGTALAAARDGGGATFTLTLPLTDAGA